jgi:hypothetical protein
MISVVFAGKSAAYPLLCPGRKPALARVFWDYFNLRHEWRAAATNATTPVAEQAPVFARRLANERPQ